MSRLGRRFRQYPTAMTALGVLGVGLAAAVLYVDVVAELVFSVELVVVLPLVYLLYGREVEEEPDERPVERLRRRYATGDLGEAEFERRLEGLLETEDLDVGSERAGERLRERE